MNGHNRFIFGENSSVQRSPNCIFISHQKHDSSNARMIADYLLNAGIDVYFDEYDTSIDRDNPISVVNAIKRGILNSTHLLCLLSRHALNSKWIPWEIGYGYDRTKVIGLTLDELSHAVLPEYLQIVEVLRGTSTLNQFISRLVGKPESSLIVEKRLFSAIQQHPLDEILNWKM